MKTAATPIKPFKHRNLPSLMLQAREAVMHHARPVLRAQSLSDQQWRVLRVLGENGVMETGQVSRSACIVGPSLTGILNRMVRDGLLTRTADANDQRRKTVQATARGRALVKALSVSIESHYQSLENRLGKDKLAQLYALLDAVIELEQA